MSGVLYVYEPVMFDLFHDHVVNVEPGALVRKTSAGPGTPRNGTMGFAYIETLDGEFAGLRRTASLRRATKADRST